VKVVVTSHLPLNSSISSRVKPLQTTLQLDPWTTADDMDHFSAVA